MLPDRGSASSAALPFSRPIGRGVASQEFALEGTKQGGVASCMGRAVSGGEAPPPPEAEDIYANAFISELSAAQRRWYCHQ